MAELHQAAADARPGDAAVLGQPARRRRCSSSAAAAAARFIFYPRPLCPSCLSDDLTWTPVSGRGVVHAFTIPHRHPNPAFAADAPYVVALIELEEGARMMTQPGRRRPDARRR